MTQQKQEIMEALLSEITSVKRLIVLLLLKTGASQSEISLALEIDQSTVSRMFPSNKIKRFDYYNKLIEKKEQ